MSNCYSSTKQKPVKVGDKQIGYFDGDKFIKPVLGSKHKLKSPPAWAIDAHVYDRVIKHNSSCLVIKDKESDIEYRCQTNTFDRLKGTLNRGFGVQYYLTLEHWEVVNTNNQPNLFDWGGLASA